MTARAGGDEAPQSQLHHDTLGTTGTDIDLTGSGSMYAAKLQHSG